MPSARRCELAAAAFERVAARAIDGVLTNRLAGHDVRASDEAGNELGFRPGIDVFRRTRLLNAAVIHHDDHVGGGHRLRLVMRDVDRGVAELVVQAANLETHLLSKIGVEVGQGFVEQ